MRKASNNILAHYVSSRVLPQCHQPLSILPSSSSSNVRDDIGIRLHFICSHLLPLPFGRSVSFVFNCVRRHIKIVCVCVGLDAINNTAKLSNGLACRRTQLYRRCLAPKKYRIQAKNPLHFSSSISSTVYSLHQHFSPLSSTSDSLDFHKSNLFSKCIQVLLAFFVRTDKMLKFSIAKHNKYRKMKCDSICRLLRVWRMSIIVFARTCVVSFHNSHAFGERLAVCSEGFCNGN